MTSSSSGGSISGGAGGGGVGSLQLVDGHAKPAVDERTSVADGAIVGGPVGRDHVGIDGLEPHLLRQGCAAAGQLRPASRGQR